MSQAQLFTLTSNFKSAIALINGLEVPRLPVILSRIIRRLETNTDEPPFSEVEEAQLIKVLDITASELNSVLEACSFIFEQSAYYQIGAATLGSQLEKTSLGSAHKEAFQKVWQEESQALISRLKSKSLFPSTLESTGWRLHLHLAQSNLSKVKQPSAIFEMDLQNDDQKKDKLILEFSKEELKKFYHQLETIQDQLDNLA